MKLKVYGNNGSEEENNTCFKLDNYLIDVPRNIFKAFDKQELNNIEKIFLTHVHPDHYGGFNDILLRIPINKKIKLYTANDIASSVRKMTDPILYFIENDGNIRHYRFEDKIDFVELKENEYLIENEYKIEIKKTKHFVPTIALKITHNGKTFAYSSDTIFDPELIGFLADADFIVHEASGGVGHTDIKNLESLSDSFKEKLYIAHFPKNIQTSLKKLERKIYTI
ncbi:MAG: ribonuclease Z [Candidatus Aenigmarchaeota archaeon]|nr:ribonuclease Z [Candidatus Aenigmarchaeota archaeon]